MGFIFAQHRFYKILDGSAEDDIFLISRRSSSRIKGNPHTFQVFVFEVQLVLMMDWL